MTSKDIYTAEKYAEDIDNLLASHSPAVVSSSSAASSSSAGVNDSSSAVRDEDLYD